MPACVVGVHEIVSGRVLPTRLPLGARYETVSVLPARSVILSSIQALAVPANCTCEFAPLPYSYVAPFFARTVNVLGPLPVAPCAVTIEKLAISVW